MKITSDDINIQTKDETTKKAPLYLNLQQTLNKKAHEDKAERRANAPKKTIMEMYRTIGAVNGPGWRPIPNRPVLETSICLMMDQQQSPVKAIKNQIFDEQTQQRDMSTKRPTKLPSMSRNNQLGAAGSNLTSPWSTKKYSMQNSQANRTMKGGDMGIFPNRRRSLGNMAGATTVQNAKAGTFAFGSQIHNGGRSAISVKPIDKQKNLQFQSTAASKLANEEAHNSSMDTKNNMMRNTTNMKSLTNDAEMDPLKRQKEIQRITSNLPEVYNRFFQTVDLDEKGKKGKKATSRDQMAETSPTKLGVSKGFSLNKTQKDEMMRDNDKSVTQTKMNETGKPSLKHYKNKNVFQKTVNSNFGGFRRKVAVEDEVNNRSQEFSIDEESNSPNR